MRGSIFEDDNTAHIDLYCIEFPFDKAWVMLLLRYWMTSLDFETRAHQTHRDTAARVLIGRHNVEVFPARFSD